MAAILHPGAGLACRFVDLAAADRAHLWHPFTQQQGWIEEEPLIVERAEGTDLIDVDGRRYIDGVSSLWCNVHGHAHPRIDAALRDQLDRVATRRCSA
jgi:adenosylmethionine-8-amino-7-oxononanoate aminotransferase